MSGRCSACNSKLTDDEMKKKVKSHVTNHVFYTDLCTHCLESGQTTQITTNFKPVLEETDEYQ